MGCTSVAAPAGFGPSGLPAEVMLVAPSFTDDALVPLAVALHRNAACGLGQDRAAAIPAPPPLHCPGVWITLAVVGAHLRGMPLNVQLADRGGVFLREARTASCASTRRWRGRLAGAQDVTDHPGWRRYCEAMAG